MPTALHQTIGMDEELLASTSIAKQVPLTNFEANPRHTQGKHGPRLL